MAALFLLAVACGGSPKVDAATAHLIDAHTALCEAAAHPDQARALFFDRSHEALHTVARDLEDVDRAEAARLLEAKQRVETPLTTSGTASTDDILALADIYRASLARLAITAPPCAK